MKAGKIRVIKKTRRANSDVLQMETEIGSREGHSTFVVCIVSKAFGESSGDCGSRNVKNQCFVPLRADNQSTAHLCDYQAVKTLFKVMAKV